MLYVSVYSYPYYIETQHRVASGILTVPADSLSAMSLGAVPWEDPTDLEAQAADREADLTVSGVADLSATVTINPPFN